jgi:hypothetical protein
MGRNGVLGVVVPISDDGVMHDIFHGKSVHASLAEVATTDLEKGDRILFYDSGKTHNIVGEAVISEIAFEQARRALNGHEGSLYLDRIPFERYFSSLPKGEASMLRVLHFRDATLYASPVKCSLKIAENGTYMTAEVFSRIARDNA